MGRNGRMAGGELMAEGGRESGWWGKGGGEGAQDSALRSGLQIGTGTLAPERELELGRTEWSALLR